MNKYQKVVRGLQTERLINLGFVKIQLGMLFPHAQSSQVKRDIEEAEMENKETDKEVKEHFDYTVWESIKLGLPF